MWEGIRKRIAESKTLPYTGRKRDRENKFTMKDVASLSWPRYIKRVLPGLKDGFLCCTLRFHEAEGLITHIRRNHLKVGLDHCLICW